MKPNPAFVAKHFPAGDRLDDVEIDGFVGDVVLRSCFEPDRLSEAVSESYGWGIIRSVETELDVDRLRLVDGKRVRRTTAPQGDARGELLGGEDDRPRLRADVHELHGGRDLVSPLPGVRRELVDVGLHE